MILTNDVFEIISIHYSLYFDEVLQSLSDVEKLTVVDGV